MITILNGTEFSLKLFKEFEVHTYNDNFGIPILEIWEDNELKFMTHDFNPENLFSIWLNLSLSQMT